MDPGFRRDDTVGLGEVVPDPRHRRKTLRAAGAIIEIMQAQSVSKAQPLCVSAPLRAKPFFLLRASAAPRENPFFLQTSAEPPSTGMVAPVV